MKAQLITILDFFAYEVRVPVWSSLYYPLVVRTSDEKGGVKVYKAVCICVVRTPVTGERQPSEQTSPKE